MVTPAHASTRPALPLAASAWLIMLAVSMLPNALFYELAGASPNWLLGAKMAMLALMTAVTLVWKDIRPLRRFFAILLGIYVVEATAGWATASTVWQGWFGGATASFGLSMLGTQLGRMAVSLTMIGVMFALGFRRADFFLARGQLDAPIVPVPWLGFPRTTPWTRFGGQWSVYIALGLLVFLLIGGHPNLPSFALPVVLLLAAMNAFSEELTYRSTLLAGLEPALGGRQALWMAALYFGLGHYFGVPYGVAGVVMATFLGWLLGKAMLETRGFFWAWFIHFVQDVLIFSFMAAGSIRPGG
jgi:membrane protease YdiL (CAAX protease family)